MKQNPAEMFLKDQRFSNFDVQGIPTHEKKMEKEQ